MSALKYTAGARTRNIVNIANPGGTDKAYELTAANSAPTAAGDGFKNFHSQKMLHILIHNNGLQTSAAAAITVSSIQIYGYNASLGGIWTRLRYIERENGGDNLIYPTFTNLEVQKDKKLRIAIPIDGIERIAVHAKTFSAAQDSGTLDIYLGVNTI